eukprot:6137547-Pyramimonas_sp.AAC.1
MAAPGSLAYEISSRSSKAKGAMGPIAATIAPRTPLSLRPKVLYAESLASSVFLSACVVQPDTTNMQYGALITTHASMYRTALNRPRINIAHERMMTAQ